MENYLTIGEVSKITGLPISTLRYFDSEGILRPYYKDEKTNYRYYKIYQIPVLKMIIHLKKLDVTNKDIKRYFENFNYSDTLNMIRLKQENIDKEIERLKLLKEQLIEDELEIKTLERLEEKVDTFYIEEKELYGIYYEISNKDFYKSITKAIKELDSFLFKKNDDTLQAGLFSFVIPQKNIEDKTYYFDKLIALKKYEDYPFSYKVKKKKYLCIICIGECNSIDINVRKSLDWMKKNGYKLDGDTLINILTGPYFRKNPFEAMYILKMPIKKIENFT